MHWFQDICELCTDNRLDLECEAGPLKVCMYAICTDPRPLQSCQGQSIVKSEINYCGCGNRRGDRYGLKYSFSIMKWLLYMCIWASSSFYIETVNCACANGKATMSTTEMREICIVMQGGMRVSVRWHSNVWDLVGLGQRRYEMITCSDENAVSSLLSPYTLHSELWWRFLRVIPRDPQVKTVLLWSAIEIITFELEIPWGSRNFLASTQQLWGHAHNDAHWYAQKSRGIIMISYLLWVWASPIRTDLT